jgi:hypothetical protein
MFTPSARRDGVFCSSKSRKEVRNILATSLRERVFGRCRRLESTWSIGFELMTGTGVRQVRVEPPVALLTHRHQAENRQLGKKHNSQDKSGTKGKVYDVFEPKSARSVDESVKDRI